MARVLIVDDSPTDKLAIYGMLKKYGHHFLFADDGESAIATAREKLPDIILMDVVMPDINGYQATRKLLKDKATAHIPVIMVTSNSDPETVQESIQNGACGFIIKPFNSARVLDTLEKIGARLRQKKT